MKPDVLKGHGAWRREWRRQPAEVRRRVKAAVVTGSLAANPLEAALAVGLARRRMRGWWLPSYPFAYPLGLVWWVTGRRKWVAAEQANWSLAQQAITQ